ncbi:MAG: methyltransferase domain-containing protein [Clostridia bacterium]|nr:methyltransferase domain-containing protein [Clostridia bacterium]
MRIKPSSKHDSKNCTAKKLWISAADTGIIQIISERRRLRRWRRRRAGDDRHRKKKYPDCTFSVLDITQPLPFDAGSFDLAFCNQVLMDVDPIGPVLSECARILKSESVFCFSIVHPALFNGDWKYDESVGKIGKLVTSYLTPEASENRFWGETTHYHRPLSCYLNAAADAGLCLTHVDEPKIYAEKRKNDDLPLFLFAEYKKTKSSR